MSKMNIKITDYLSEEARRIRQEVFVKEQGFQNEFDEIDSVAKHLVLFDDEKPIACCRYFKGNEKGDYVVGRIAVNKEYRGMQLGRRLLEETEKQVIEFGGKQLSLSAQVRVRSFYEKLGFVAHGDTYMDEFCEHVHMVKDLNKLD